MSDRRRTYSSYYEGLLTSGRYLVIFNGYSSNAASIYDPVNDSIATINDIPVDTCKSGSSYDGYVYLYNNNVSGYLVNNTGSDVKVGDNLSNKLGYSTGSSDYYTTKIDVESGSIVNRKILGMIDRSNGYLYALIEDGSYNSTNRHRFTSVIMDENSIVTQILSTFYIETSTINGIDQFDLRINLINETLYFIQDHPESVYTINLRTGDYMCYSTNFNSSSSINLNNPAYLIV